MWACRYSEWTFKFSIAKLKCFLAVIYSDCFYIKYTLF